MMEPKPWTYHLEESVLKLLSLSLMPIDIQLSVSLIRKLPTESLESRDRPCSSSMMSSNLTTSESSKSLPRRMSILPTVSFSVSLRSLKDLDRDLPNTLESSLDQLLDMSSSTTEDSTNSSSTTYLEKDLTSHSKTSRTTNLRSISSLLQFQLPMMSQSKLL